MRLRTYSVNLLSYAPASLYFLVSVAKFDISFCRYRDDGPVVKGKLSSSYYYYIMGVPFIIST